MSITKLNNNQLDSKVYNQDNLISGKNITIEDKTIPSTGGIDANTLMLLHLDDNLDDSSNYGVVPTGSYTPTFEIGKFDKAISDITGYKKYTSSVYSTLLSQNGEMTIDFWVRKGTSYGSSYSSLLYFYKNPGNGVEWYCQDANTFYFSTNTKPTVIWNVTGNTYDISSIAEGTFFHVAFVVESTLTAKLYINGTLVNTGTVTSTFPFSSWTYTQFLARSAGVTDELRISCVARWTDNFTPPTAPYSQSNTYTPPVADANTIDIFNCETLLPLSSDTEMLGSQGNMRIYRDSSATGYSVSPNSVNASFENCYAQTSREEIYIKKASSPVNSSLFNSTEFTVDFWYRTTESTENNYELIDWSDGILYLTGSGTLTRGLMFMGTDVTTETANDVFPLYQWNHIELSRNSSGLVRVFVNGTKVIETSTAAMLNSNWYIELAYGGNKNIDAIRVSNNVRHTADFTLLAQPYSLSTAIKTINSNNSIQSTSVKNIVKCTQATYDALVQAGTVNPTTFYAIIPEDSDESN